MDSKACIVICCTYQYGQRFWMNGLDTCIDNQVYLVDNPDNIIFDQDMESILLKKGYQKSINLNNLVLYELPIPTKITALCNLYFTDNCKPSKLEGTNETIFQDLESRARCPVINHQKLLTVLKDNLEIDKLNVDLFQNNWESLPDGKYRMTIARNFIGTISCNDKQSLLQEQESDKGSESKGKQFVAKFIFDWIDSTLQSTQVMNEQKCLSIVTTEFEKTSGILQIKGVFAPTSAEVQTFKLTFLELALDYSYRYILSSKTILMIAGGVQKTDLEKISANIVLVHDDPSYFAKGMVKHFIHVPELNNNSKDELNTTVITDSIKRLEICIDGVVTFWEYCASLTAKVANALGVVGNSPEAVAIARNKFRTMECLNNSSDNGIVKYGTEVIPVYEEKDLGKIPTNWFPVVLKYCTGAAAFGIELAANADDLKQGYQDLIDLLGDQYNSNDKSKQVQIMVSKLIKGSEHDVETVICNGDLVAAFVSDNGPAVHPLFFETSLVMPSQLSFADQQELIDAAYQSLLSVGLSEGSFNVELFLTSEGAKLIEINARPGGCHMPQCLRSVFNVDIRMWVCLISVGIKPLIISAPKARMSIITILLFPRRHGSAFTKEILCQIAEEMSNEVIVATFDSTEGMGAGSGKYEKPCGYVEVMAKTMGNAREKMQKVFQIADYSLPEYQCIVPKRKASLSHYLREYDKE